MALAFIHATSDSRPSASTGLAISKIASLPGKQNNSGFARRFRQSPHQRVFAPAFANDQNSHPPGFSRNPAADSTLNRGKRRRMSIYGVTTVQPRAFSSRAGALAGTAAEQQHAACGRSNHRGGRIPRLPASSSGSPPVRKSGALRRHRSRREGGRRLPARCKRISRIAGAGQKHERLVEKLHLPAGLAIRGDLHDRGAASSQSPSACSERMMERRRVIESASFEENAGSHRQTRPWTPWPAGFSARVRTG